MKNRIGWCSETFNPVVGCKNNCEYCYARTMNKRFKFIKNWNSPEWKEKSFNKKFPKKPQRIFVGSMSEIAHWKKEWIEKVIEKIKQYPQHTFIFLTKFPKVYYGKIFPKNCYLGVTITKENGFEKNDEWWGWFFHETNFTFFSFEPLLESIDTEWIGYSNIDWVIIGAETGNRKGKVIPKKEWIESIIDYCRDNDIPIYLKDSLKEVYPVEIKEFPEVK